MDRLLSAMEVSNLVGCSVYTLNNWYRFKKDEPDSEYAQMLPDIVYTDTNDTVRRKRYWNKGDVIKLIEFKEKIPKGRNGVMAGVTQKYYKKKQKEITVNG